MLLSQRLIRCEPVSWHQGHGLAERVKALEETGPTALGPALVAAIDLANRRSGGKGAARIVLCTDGLSNGRCSPTELEPQ